MVIEDEEIVNIPMNDKPFKGKKFAHSLRLNIF